jgi:hypothetical protein
MRRAGLLLAVVYLCLSQLVVAKTMHALAIDDETDVEIRRFEADGEILLLGFACDEGASINEETTAAKLAADGIEVWMPDLLSAYLLPRLPSSIAQIPTDALSKVVGNAGQTGKQVYLIAAGVETELVLRALAELEKSTGPGKVKGAILLFPRLLKGDPQPGNEPEYVSAVGRPRGPLLIIEGERTPNRWGLPHLRRALSTGGSTVNAIVVPDIRGFFYKRADANISEDTVTEQMHGLLKAALFQLRSAE